MGRLINSTLPSRPRPSRVCPLAVRPSGGPPAGDVIAPSPQLEPSAHAPSTVGATPSKQAGLRGSPSVGHPDAPPLCRTPWPRRASIGSRQVPGAGGSTVPTGPIAHSRRISYPQKGVTVGETTLRAWCVTPAVRLSRPTSVALTGAPDQPEPARHAREALHNKPQLASVGCAAKMRRVFP